MPLLTAPLTVKGMTLRNRLVMPPMATEKSAPGGGCSPEMTAYYEERARDEALGLIITEHAFILPQGKASPNQAGMDSDDKIEGWRMLTDTVHKYGTCIAAQISHAGGRAKSQVTGMTTVGPSLGPIGKAEGAEHALTADEIKTITDAFAAAAGRAKAAGFDAVEIHSAHSYLLDQFYSPLSNRREDGYGGSLSGRIRFHLEVIRAVRETVGEDYPILLRLGACDYLEGGAELADAVAACEAFQQAGVDLLDISGGLSGYMIPQRLHLQGYFAIETAAIRDRVSVPVLLTGGITQPEAAEALLKDGAADLIGVGRAILKDPHWAKDALITLNDK